MLPYLIAGAIGFVVGKLLEQDEAPKYEFGGLIAPNGKPSNLTPEQYKLVRTPAFKKWFGDWENDPTNASKVVDFNGEPLVVYHGTKKEFNIFDKTKIGFNTSNALRGFYFSDNSSVAYSYTYDENEGDYLGDVIEVFLYANKIKTIDADNKDWVELSENDYIDKQIKKAFESGYDCVIVKNIADPFIDMDNGTDYYGNTFVVDSSNQIKLANGTNTTFDGKNPDIRFMAGGETDKQKIIKKTYGWYSSFKDRYYKDLNSAYSDIERVVENNNKQFGYLFGNDNPKDIINLFNFIETQKGVVIKPKLKKIEQKKNIEYNTDIDLVNKQKQIWEYAHGIEIGRYISSLQYINTDDERIYGTEKPDEQNIVALMNKLRKGDELPPILLDYDYGILDGHHRFEASKRLKIKKIPIIIYEHPDNPDIEFMAGGELTNNDVLKNFVNQVEAYQSNHYGTFNRDNLVESYHKLPDSIKEKIKPISTKNLFRGADGTSYKSAISFTKNQDYAKMFGAYAFPFKVVKENKGLIDTKRLSALLSKMRIANEIGDDEGEVIVIEPIFSEDIYENIEKFRFYNGGLIAPNGKPSKLTPEQYKLVRKPEFKAWFGDWENSPETASKVVDENGEPLVCYHGTNSEFYKFDKSKGKGNIKQKSINFSSNKNVSENYGTRIIKCFLNLKNPFIKNYNGENYHTITFYARFDNRINDIPDNIVNNAQTEKKYDGVIFLNIQDSKSAYDNFSVPIANNYYAFNNNQIKLADGTNTTFDGNNPDIRYAGGGEIEELKFSNKIESDAMGYDIGDYLYHITPVSNFNTIINKGFIPKNGISINNKPFENRLYFATSLISAYDLSVNFGSYRDNSKYVIFKIKSDCINDYEEDNLFAHGIYVDYKVSNKCIVGYVNANELFNKFDDEDIDNLYY